MDTGVEVDHLAGLVDVLRNVEPASDDAARIDRIRLLEELTSVAAAVQAAETAAFAASQRAAAAVAGVATRDQGRGVASQVGLARRMSPWAASRYVGWCTILTGELPATFAQLRAGRTSPWRAMLVARETIFLSAADRAAVDAELAPQLQGLGDRRVEAAVKAAAYRLDPHGFVERSRAAANDRRVTMRPAPDTMCRLTALLPVAQGVAAYAALGRHADAAVVVAVAVGDDRGRGQIMADTLVERLTGQATADAVPVEIELVITDRTLLDPNSTEPASIPGYGPLPAGTARDLALGSDTSAAPRWLRRLFRHPATGELAAMDTHRRFFTENEARFIRLRDHGTCRTPWCDAPIRHCDHITPHSQGGSTNVDNGQGLCEACNHARQADRWISTVSADRVITTRTPTGHRYRSRPPDPPRAASAVEHRLRGLLAAG